MSDDSGKILLALAGIVCVSVAGVLLATSSQTKAPDRQPSRLNPLLSAKQLQKELLAGLSAAEDGVDPYDFVDFIGEYLEEQGEPETDYVTDWLDDDSNRARFHTWLQQTKKLESWMHDAPGDVPARYWFSDPTALPAGSWLIHHSDVAFYDFDRGTTWDHLAFTWSSAARVGDHNLYDDIGSYERVYGFAFEAESDECVTRLGTNRCAGRRPKYGSNMLLFQCDAAVQAYHWGDEEHQVVFPVGSEYNVHRLVGDYDGSWWIEDPNTGEDVNLPTIQDVMDRLMQPKRSKKRAKR